MVDGHYHFGFNIIAVGVIVPGFDYPDLWWREQIGKNQLPSCFAQADFAHHIFGGRGASR